MEGNQAVEESESTGEENAEFTPVSIDEIVTEEIVKEIFAKCNRSLEVESFEVSNGTHLGDNYCSLMYSVLVTAKNKKSGNISVIPMMFKALPRNPIRVQMITESKYFLKEYNMYMNIFPNLGTPGLSFTAHPKAMHAFCDGAGDYIAMEDLRPLGFKMEDRIQGWDMEHATLVMKELAKFHALSFVNYKGEGEVMLAEFPYLEDTFWKAPDTVQDMYAQFVDNTFKSIIGIIEAEGFGHNRQRIEVLIENIFEKMNDLTSLSERFPSVINHGDCWTNNVLFRHDDKGSPVELKFLDFQISKVGSRFIDLSYIMYTSLSVPLLNKNCMDILKIYYDAFNQYCDELGADMPLRYNGEKLSWKLFQTEWFHYQHYGTTMALFLLPVMMAKSEDAFDMENIKQTDIDTPDVDNTQFERILANEALREKLVNIVDNHLPMCLKPVEL